METHAPEAPQTIASSNAVAEKTKELCEAILEQAGYKESLAKVESFFTDESARDQYISFTELGQQLHQKQHAGEEITSEDEAKFQELQTAAMENATISDFMMAQQNLQVLNNEIATMVGKTIELGHLPTAEELGGGGESCGEGCGCH